MQITGIILISVGATVQGVFHDYSEFLTGDFFSVPKFLIAIGVIIFIIAIFGCCGAIRENYCMILTFAILMVLVFILEMAAGISGYVLRNDTQALVEQELQRTMQKYVAQEADIIYIWDHVQRGFECCGVNSFEDWEKVTTDSEIPISCCSDVPGTIGTFVCNSTSETLFKRGCGPSFSEFIRAHAVSLGAAGIVICIIQFVGIFFACFLARQIKNKTGAGGF